MESGLRIKGTDCDKANKLVLSVLALILCGKMPDLGIKDKLYNKVKLASAVTSVSQNIEAQIRSQVFDKGLPVEAKDQLLELEYSTTFAEHTLSAPGGLFQQFYYVVQAILETQENNLFDFYTRRLADPQDQTSHEPQNARELLIEEFFLPFLANYLQSLESGMTVMVTPEMGDKLAELGIKANAEGFYELSNLDERQYRHFRYYFFEVRMFNERYIKNSNKRAMQLLFECLTLILSNRLPQGMEIHPDLHKKVRLAVNPYGPAGPSSVHYAIRVQSVTKKFCGRLSGESRVLVVNDAAAKAAR